LALFPPQSEGHRQKLFFATWAFSIPLFGVKGEAEKDTPKILTKGELMLDKELKENLEKIAYKKSTKFCYSCYHDAPEGRCKTCGTDDLMLRSKGGLEYGTEHVILELIEENLTSINLEEEFESMIRECYPETVTVLWMELDSVTVAKESDPTSWRIAVNEYADQEESEGNIVSFDNGSTYYRTSEVEEYALENLPEEEEE